tara:strand:+ start:16299 stop:16880 length:582 start_codon:yes stop_codon:yes gene_type:complete
MLDFFDIPPEVFESLKGIANDTNIDKSHDLAGNIEKEYDLTKYIPLIEPTLMNVIKDPKTAANAYVKEVKIIKHLKLKQQDFWVNHMYKHEFNPAHSHSGLFSFILFIQIPYLIQDEMNNPKSKNSNSPLSGFLQFLHLEQRSRGGIGEHNVPVDKTYEGKGFIFPAFLKHVVYPFYTTDLPRITMSGNIYAV